MTTHTRKPKSSLTMTQCIPKTICPLPVYGSKVQAGFPSPADEFLEGTLDLNEYLIRHPSATFMVRVAGNSMMNAGIFEGDLLIVDRSLDPKHNHIVIAILNRELTVKRLIKRGKQISLKPENDAYQIITPSKEDELLIWGVVTHVIRSV